MALVRTREVNSISAVTTDRKASPPSIRQNDARPNLEKQTIPSMRPFSHQSAREVEKRLPERQLLSRYRHVYAGKGGWFVSRTSSTPPVTINSGSSNGKYLDVYRKELILRLSKDIFENNKHLLKKDRVVSNKVIGAQRDDVIESSALPQERTKIALDVKSSEKTSQGSLMQITDKVSTLNEKKNRLVSLPERVSELVIGSTHTKSMTSDTENTNQGTTTTKEIQTGEIDVKTSGVCEALQKDINIQESVYNGVEQKSKYYPERDFNVNKTENDQDNCFVTSFQRAHTIIGTLRTGENNKTTTATDKNNARQTDQSKQSCENSSGHETRLAEAKGSDGSITEDGRNVNIVKIDESEVEEKVNNEIKTSREPGEKKTHKTKGKYALGEIQLNVLRQRSFVKLPSNSMTEVQRRPYTRGALKHSGKFVPRSMSQEALLAINETRKEMGIRKSGGENGNTNKTPTTVKESVVTETENNTDLVDTSSTQDKLIKDCIKVPLTDDRNTPPPPLNPQTSDYGNGLAQPSAETFNSTMDSYKSNSGELSSKSKSLLRRSVDNDQQKQLAVSSSEAMKIQLKSGTKQFQARQKREKSKTVDAIPGLSSMTENGKQNSGRYSFHLSKEPGYSNRQSNKRYFNSNIKPSKDLNNSISNPSSVFLGSPRTKFPHLKLASISQEDIRKNAHVTSQSRGSSQKLSSIADNNEETEDKLAPLKPKRTPVWKFEGALGLTKEKSFQITPPGWDVRYRDIYGKGHIDFSDNTPEEVKEKAIEKCNAWLIKYV